MIYIVLGVILGIVAGLNINMEYNSEYTVYISLVILAIINTIFNILCENIKNNTNLIRCLVYLTADLLLAFCLGFIGEQLGLPIYLAAIFAFGNNIYNNVKILVNTILDRKNL